MKQKLQVAIPIVIIIAFLCLMFVFRTIPVSRMWEKYCVLYVHNSISESDVLGYCDKLEIKNVISLSNVNLPSGDSTTSYLENFIGNDNFFSISKKNYFIDKSNRFNIFYIPEKYESSINELLNIFQDKAGTDKNQSYPLIPFAIALAASSLFFVFSNKKIRQFFISIPVLFYTFCIPFYVSSIGAILILYVLFLFENLIYREKILKSVFKSIFILFLTLIAFIAVSLSGFLSILLFLLTICCVCLLEYVLYNIKKYIDDYVHFKTISILPATLVFIKSKRNIYLLFVPVFSIVIAIFFSLNAESFTKSKSENDLSIPAPKEYTEKSVFTVESFNRIRDKQSERFFPDLSDWVIYQWNIESFMYHSLFLDDNYSVVPKAGDVLSLPTYEFVSADGSTIVEKDNVVIVFNDDFITESVNKASVRNGTLEQLLAFQGRFATVVYRKIGSYASADFLTIIELCCILILISPILIEYKLKRKSNK